MNRFIKITSTLLLTGVIFVVFSGSQAFAYKNTINQLFNDRINIMQNAFYENTKIDDTENALRSIEVTPVLISDMESITNLDATEIDTVKSVEVSNVKKIKNNDDLMTFTAHIKWEMQGLQGNYSDDYDYIIILKNDNNVYRLSDYYPVF